MVISSTTYRPSHMDHSAVYTDAHVCVVYMYVNPCVTASSQCRLSSSVIFHFFSHSISLNLELVDSARLAGQKAPGMFLSPLPQWLGLQMHASHTKMAGACQSQQGGRCMPATPGWQMHAPPGWQMHVSQTRTADVCHTRMADHIRLHHYPSSVLKDLRSLNKKRSRKIKWHAEFLRISRSGSSIS